MRQLVQPVQVDSQTSGFTHEDRNQTIEAMTPIEFVDQPRHHEQNARLIELSSNFTQEFETGRIGPMEVFEIEEQRYMVGKVPRSGGLDGQSPSGRSPLSGSVESASAVGNDGKPSCGR